MAPMDADVIVVGAGLAGLVAAAELLERGRSVLIVDQENEANIGGQAFWSFGGLFFVDSVEQRRQACIRDNYERARWKIGCAQRVSTATRITGPSSGRAPTSTSRPAKRSLAA